MKTCEDLKKVFTLISCCITNRWTISVKSEDFFAFFFVSLLPSHRNKPRRNDVISVFPTLCFAPCILVIYALHPYGSQPANLWLAPCIHIVCGLHSYSFQLSNTHYNILPCTLIKFQPSYYYRSITGSLYPIDGFLYYCGNYRSGRMKKKHCPVVGQCY